jgi:hypothetical protein
LKAILGENAVDASLTDREAALAKFLGNHLGGGIGIEETVSDGLTHQLLGSAVVCLGTWALAGKAINAVFQIVVANLKVVLSAKAIFAGSLLWANAGTFAFGEHEQLAGYVVGFGNEQETRGTENHVSFHVKRNHGVSFLARGGQLFCCTIPV